MHDDPLPTTKLDWTVQGRTYRVTAAMLDRNAKAVSEARRILGGVIVEIRPANPAVRAADGMDLGPSARPELDPAPVGRVVQHPDPRGVRREVARAPGRARPGRVSGSGGGGAEGEDTGQLSLFGGVSG